VLIKTVPQVALRRPGLIAAVAFTLGVYLAHQESLTVVLIMLAVAMAIFGVLQRLLGSSALLLLLCFALGLFRMWLSTGWISEAEIRNHMHSHDRVLLYGTISVEPDIRPTGVRVYVDADSVRSVDSLCIVSGTVCIRFTYDYGLRYGEEVILAGILTAPNRALNPGEFDWGDYLARRGVFAQLKPASGSPVLHVRPAEPGWLNSVVIPLRQWTHDQLTRHLSGEESSLMQGLLWGEKEAMDPATVAAFKDTGTLHLLAVSGSNVGVVIAVIWGMLTFLRLPRSFRIGCSLFAVLLFCYLAHNEPSVVRASVAGALVLLAVATRRRADAYNILGVSLFLILSVDPLQVLGVGFQLSYAATFGILMVAPLLRPSKQSSVKKRVGHYLGAALLVSVAAQLTTLPILAATFNVVPLVTPLSNLVCVPVAGLATAAGVVTLLVAPLGPQALLVTSGCTWLTARALAEAVKLFAGWNFPQWQMSTPGGFDVALYYAALAAVYLFWRSPHWRRPLVGLALVVILGLQVRAWVQGAPDLEGIVFHCRGSVCSALRWKDGDVWWITEYGKDARCRRIISDHTLRQGWGPPTRVFALTPKPVSPDTGQHGIITAPDPEETLSQGHGRWLVTRRMWRGTNVLHSLEVSTPWLTAVWSLVAPSRWSQDSLSRDLILLVGAPPGAWPTGTTHDPDSVILITSSGTADASESNWPSSVQLLNTRQTGAVRIVWRDGGLQAETSIR
jgi:ComEC/Rec2-related protein